MSAKATYLVALALVIAPNLGNAKDSRHRAEPDPDVITAPYIRSTGATVPAGRWANRKVDAGMGVETPQYRRDDRIDGSICRGC